MHIHILLASIMVTRFLYMECMGEQGTSNVLPSAMLLGFSAGVGGPGSLWTLSVHGTYTGSYDVDLYKVAWKSPQMVCCRNL